MSDSSPKPNVALLRSLPQVEEVLQQPALTALEGALPHRALTDCARNAIDALRQQILRGGEPVISTQEVAAQAALAAHALMRPSLRRVINATGVIIHTNLGRSPLASEAVAAVNEVMAGYSTLEYNAETMARGSRHAHCESLICALTGAEAAIAVNNNAAAVMMVLSEFAAGHQAIVSRGELIEIGGSFRIPDIMELSHAEMVEVGTTNKTHPIDYERALAPGTAMMLKVHPSNYRLIGFTEHVEVHDLRIIADAENARREAAEAEGAAGGQGAAPVLVYEDQGSGAFSRLDVFGTYAEPTVAESLRQGADIVSFSGDKLLGGPQAGIIVGRKALIDRLKKNPLARALRLDKMTLAALEATLRLYLHPETAQQRIPTLRMLTESSDDTRKRAEKMLEAVSAKLPHNFAHAETEPEIARAGGGALPMCDIPTYVVAVSFAEPEYAQRMHEFLIQQCDIPVITRIRNEKLLFDARTVLDDGEIEIIAASVARCFAK